MPEQPIYTEPLIVPEKTKNTSPFSSLLIVAAILVVLGVGLYVYSGSKSTKPIISAYQGLDLSLPPNWKSYTSIPPSPTAQTIGQDRPIFTVLYSSEKLPVAQLEARLYTDEFYKNPPQDVYIINEVTDPARIRTITALINQADKGGYMFKICT
jgi:hypothetical protein